MSNHGLTINDLSGIYRDIAEIIGIDATILLHYNFQGQQITFPKKLYTREYIVSQIENKLPNNNLKHIAKEYGYTERRLRQMIEEQNQKLT